MNEQLIEKEYDFSQGEKGKYFSPENTYEYAIYVSEKNYLKLKEIAKKENNNIEDFTNNLIENINI
jgi:hypothetical protein